MLSKKDMIRKAMEMAALNLKISQKGKEELTLEEQELLKSQEELFRVEETDVLGKIKDKISGGKELEEEEIHYLEMNVPEMYEDYLEVMQERKTYMEQIKACRTKKEVKELHKRKVDTYMGLVQKAGPNGKASREEGWKYLEKLLSRVAAAEDVYRKYKSSTEFKNLK